MTTQEAVYRYIKQYIQQQGFAPDYRSIAAGCGISMGTVTYHLNNLEHADYIQRMPRRWRTIELTGKLWE